MAELTNDDFKAIRRLIRQDPVGRQELRVSALSKVQWKSALQAIEDNFEANRAAVKTDVDAAAGVTLTNPMAKKLSKAWMQRKFFSE